MHYQMAPCLEQSARARGNSNSFILTRRSGVYVTGGETVDCPFCSRDNCLTLCAAREDCVAIDYYHIEIEEKCVLHNASTACNPFELSSIASHYTVRAPDHCDEQGTQTSGNGFVEVNFAGPTVLPSGWQEYPARHQLSGRTLGSANMTGDECVDMCKADPNCFALDYNTIDGSCFSHWTEERKCTPLLDSSDVYHIKKPGTCADPTYPAPTRVGLAL